MAKQTVRPETWVGLFLVLGILLFIGLILGFGNVSGGKEETYSIHIVFKDAAGLIKGSQIRLGGVAVGKVTGDPKLLDSGTEVMLTAEIQGNVMIPQGSEFRIDMQNILGDKYIDIVPPDKPDNTYIQADATVTGQPESDFSKLKNSAVVAAGEILVILKKLESNTEHMDEAFKNIAQAADGITRTTELINEQILKQQNLQQLETTLLNLARASEQLPDLMTETHATVTRINETSQATKQLVQHVHDKVQTLDPTIKKIPQMIDRAEQAGQAVTRIAQDAGQNKGVLGLLLYDKDFRSQVQEFMSNLREYGILRYRTSKEAPPKADPRKINTGTRL